MKLKTFLSDGLSLNEGRVSLLMIAFAIGFGICVYSYFIYGDSVPVMAEIVKHIGTLIVGANVAQPLISNLTKDDDSEK